MQTGPTFFLIFLELNRFKMCANFFTSLNPLKIKKVAVYNVGFDYNATESSATVLFKSSAEIAKYSNDEDKFAEQLVKSIADTGVKVVICSGKSSNLMLHYANKYDIMVLSVSSKWVIRRLCVSLDAKPMIKMEVITNRIFFVDFFCGNFYV